MALAVLLSFVLAPLVKLLQRFYLPRFAAVTIVVLLAFGVISGLATLMFAQVSQLAGDLPRYQSNLAEKVQALRGATTASGMRPFFSYSRTPDRSRGRADGLRS